LQFSWQIRKHTTGVLHIQCWSTDDLRDSLREFEICLTSMLLGSVAALPDAFQFPSTSLRMLSCLRRTSQAFSHCQAVSPIEFDMFRPPDKHRANLLSGFRSISDGVRYVPTIRFTFPQCCSVVLFFHPMPLESAGDLHWIRPNLVGSSPVSPMECACGVNRRSLPDTPNLVGTFPGSPMALDMSLLSDVQFLDVAR
jgi:hypothetical protein